VKHLDMYHELRNHFAKCAAVALAETP